MPDKHAKLSCSSSMRWINCPGSVHLSEYFPQSTSIYADEGTIAHLYLEESVKDDPQGRQAALDKAAAFYKEHPEMGDSANSIRDNIDAMMAWILSEYQKEKAADPAVEVYSEQQVDLMAYIPDGFGTTDVTIARTGFIHIIDLKYGKGVPVHAEGNTQLRLYALGMLEMLDMIYDIRQIRMTIYQPRLANISTDEISASDLREWGSEVIRPAARLALSEDAPFSAGSWCQFCPARKTCRCRADHMMALENYRIKTTLTDGEIGHILGEIDDLTKWAEDLKAAALTKIQEGGDIPGWKVVEGKSNRKFKDGTEEKAIVAAARKAGFEKALLYETKMLTLSQIEKLMGKKTFTEALGQYVVKPQGKPTLVPESDKRASIIGGNARDVFAEELPL